MSVERLPSTYAAPGRLLARPMQTEVPARIKRETAAA
jgi:hypothetical protein